MRKIPRQFRRQHEDLSEWFDEEPTAWGFRKRRPARCRTNVDLVDLEAFKAKLGDSELGQYLFDLYMKVGREQGKSLSATMAVYEQQWGPAPKTWQGKPLECAVKTGDETCQ